MARRMAAAGLILAAVMMAGGCESQEQKAIKRSTDLVQSLKQRSFPGLPEHLSTEQALAIDKARSGPGAWFVETGCFSCHAVSVYGVTSPTQMGPDLSLAQEDVEKRFGKKLDEFWREPIGTMTMVRSQLIKMTPEEQAVGLQKLRDAYAAHLKQSGATK